MGTSSIIKASINFGNLASVGAENGNTVQVTVGEEVSYWEETLTTNTVSYSLNLANVLPNKTTVRYSKVACYIEAKISESYTEEQGMFGNWYKLNDTKKSNYYARYYIGDLCTFVYNDNTFGDQTIGEYLANGTVKTY